MARFAVYLRKLRRWFMRSYWELRLIPLSKSEGTADLPGLIFIQIDGLSRTQMKKALKNGHLPFLRWLSEKKKYVQYSHYSGLPSATPGVQGELFYGVKTCVPAFHFRDRESNQILRMYDPKSAGEIEKRLARENRALLEGGSSYSNIFCGGAAESHFCAATFGWQGFFKALNPMRWIFLFIFHIDILLRTTALLVAEFFLAIYDSIRGILKGHGFVLELQFIFMRVFVCVLLREFILLGAKIDIARGLPIIHVNFFGYDEQAHRRGPSSAFAHWCLRGIDGTVASLWKAASIAERRHYDLWIYSDHGQEDTLPYPVEHGRRIEEVVAEIFGKTIAGEVSNSKKRYQPNYSCCGGRYSSAHAQKAAGEVLPELLMTGMGPLSHIYPEVPLSLDEKIHLAGEIIRKAKVPLVLIPEQGQEVQAVTAAGIYKLPKEAESVLGKDHPFLSEVTQDLIELCHHPSAGQMIISGWLAAERPRTFPVENGSHAGFGSEETHGFALLPHDAPVPERKYEYLRPLDLRRAVLRLLGRFEIDKITTSDLDLKSWDIPEVNKQPGGVR
ncbi:MAG: hypothetical protein HYZ83_02990 [Candidatus Omnitrophica bacterium]|nr:hypothetical protein [Candidatus Omnitrophota bacterium]